MPLVTLTTDTDDDFYIVVDSHVPRHTYRVSWDPYKPLVAPELPPLAYGKQLVAPPSLCNFVEGIPTVEMARRLNALCEYSMNRGIIQQIVDHRIKILCNDEPGGLQEAPGRHTILILEDGYMEMCAIGLLNAMRREGEPPLAARYSSDGKLLAFQAHVPSIERTT